MKSEANFVGNFDSQVSPYKGVTIVIFGASGDLAKRKLLPSLNSLCSLNLLPKPFHIICYGRTKYTTETYKEELQQSNEYSSSFLEIVHYVSGQYKDCPELRGIFSVEENQSLNRIFYLSLPPSEFRNVCVALKETEMITANSGAKENSNTDLAKQPYTRIILEKPFGEDYDSAVELHSFVSEIFDFSQVQCIDHYLGKDPVQNILFFRFANPVFEPIWNSKNIEYIQINVDEKIQVEDRAGYFDSSGMLRDMIQSHALQVLALTLMDAPQTYNAMEIRKEKSKVLAALRSYTSEDDVRSNVVRGQYKGYLQENGVNENSSTETFVALKTYVDTERWAKMPIFIRSGKALKEKNTEIIIQFKKLPNNIFGDEELSNQLVFRIQPDASIYLTIQSKIPGNEIQLLSTQMNFPYHKQFEHIDFSNGYDRILFSGFVNDASLFLSKDELFAQWKFADSVIKTWKQSQNIPLYEYAIASAGPKEAQDLLERNGK